MVCSLPISHILWINVGCTTIFVHRECGKKIVDNVGFEHGSGQAIYSVTLAVYYFKMFGKHWRNNFFTKLLDI
jgi:hypothetical protein